MGLVHAFGSANPNWRDAGRHVCIHCGKEFKSYAKNRIYCGQACYAAAMKGRELPKKPLTACKKCGQPAVRYRAFCLVCRPQTSWFCTGCGERVKRKLQWCMSCRLAGKHLGPEPTSTCAACGFVIMGIRYRKYCDKCLRAYYTMRRGTPRKTDANQQEIVAALRDVGCVVADISETGRGVPDLLVKRPDGELVLIEVKNPKAKGKLNALQKDFHEKWAGVTFVVYTVEEALKIVGAIR